jgi:hypothetical protein
MKRIELVFKGVAWTDRATKYATCVASPMARPMARSVHPPKKKGEFNGSG